jgi:hypothetical protein
VDFRRTTAFCGSLLRIRGGWVIGGEGAKFRAGGVRSTANGKRVLKKKNSITQPPRSAEFITQPPRITHYITQPPRITHHQCTLIILRFCGGRWFRHCFRRFTRPSRGLLKDFPAPSLTLSNLNQTSLTSPLKESSQEKICSALTVVHMDFDYFTFLRRTVVQTLF